MRPPPQTTTWLRARMRRNPSCAVHCARVIAALIAAVSAPVYAWLLGPREAEPMAVVLAIALLVILRHTVNIQRLLDGTESKISFGKKRA